MHDDRVAGPDRHTADLDALFGDAKPSGMCHVGEPEDFLDGALDQARIASQLLQLFRVIQQRRQAEAKRAGGRLVPSIEKQACQTDNLSRRDRARPHVFDNQPAEQIVAGVLVLEPDEVGQVAVAELFDHRRRCIMRGRPRRDILGPALDRCVIGLRHAKQRADRLTWQRNGEFRDQIGRGSSGGHLLDQRVDQRLHSWPEPLGGGC